MVVVLAYADDVTAIIKNQNEQNIINEHLQLYEEVSGAKLNHNKIGVWIGRDDTCDQHTGEREYEDPQCTNNS